MERGNDGQGSIGVCPKCQFVPLRVWDTFVSDQNNFFLAVTYATDNGVKVIEGADGGLYHSAFAEKALALRLRARRRPALLGRRPEHRQPQLPGRLQPRDADPGRGRRRRGAGRGAARAGGRPRASATR